MTVRMRWPPSLHPPTPSLTTTPRTGRALQLRRLNTARNAPGFDMHALVVLDHHRRGARPARAVRAERRGAAGLAAAAAAVAVDDVAGGGGRGAGGGGGGRVTSPISGRSPSPPEGCLGGAWLGGYPPRPHTHTHTPLCPASNLRDVHLIPPPLPPSPGGVRVELAHARVYLHRARGVVVARAAVRGLVPRERGLACGEVGVEGRREGDEGMDGGRKGGKPGRDFTV